MELSKRRSAAIAQLGERQTEDLKVPGSIPGGGRLFFRLRLAWQKSVLGKKAPPAGFEPATFGLEVRRAIRCAMEAIN